MNSNNDTFILNSTDEVLKQKFIDAIENKAGISVRQVDVKLKDDRLDIRYEMTIPLASNFIEFSVVLDTSAFKISEYLLKNEKEK